LFAGGDPSVERYERRFDVAAGESDFSLSEKALLDGARNPLAFSITYARIYGFRRKLGDIGLYVLQVRLNSQNPTLWDLCALGRNLREFYCEIVDAQGNRSTMGQFIRSIAPLSLGLHDNAGRPDSLNQPKLKALVAADLIDTVSESMVSELVYDLGCFSKPGTAGGNEWFSPSPQYFDEITAGIARPFRNYQALALFDSHAFVGTSFLNRRVDSWREEQVAIYVYNLYIKYRSLQLSDDVVSTVAVQRNATVEFLATFGRERIALTFLPNIFHARIRAALEIDAELENLGKHVATLSRTLDESSRRRQNTLLGLVSALSAIDSYPVIVASLKRIEDATDLHGPLWWLIVTLVVFGLALASVRYMFPHHFRLILRFLRSFLLNRRR